MPKTLSKDAIDRIQTHYADGRLRRALEGLCKLFKESGDDDLLVETEKLLAQLSHLESASREDYSQREWNRISNTTYDLIKKGRSAVEKFAEDYDEIKEGKLMHDIPQQMQKDKEEICRVRISDSIKLLRKGLFNFARTSKPENIHIGEVMEVELIATENDAFRIKPLSPTEREMAPNDADEWMFAVTPLRAGKHRLALKVHIVKERQGQKRVANPKTIPLEIEVAPHPISGERVWKDVATFVTTADMTFRSLTRLMFYQYPALQATVIVFLMTVVGAGAVGLWKLFSDTDSPEDTERQPELIPQQPYRVYASYNFTTPKVTLSQVNVPYSRDVSNPKVLIVRNELIPSGPKPDSLDVRDGDIFYRGKIDRARKEVRLRVVEYLPSDGCYIDLVTSKIIKSDTVEVWVDNQWQKGVKINDFTARIPFCKTSGEHRFRVRTNPDSVCDKTIRVPGPRCTVSLDNCIPLPSQLTKTQRLACPVIITVSGYCDTVKFKPPRTPIYHIIGGEGVHAFKADTSACSATNVSSWFSSNSSCNCQVVSSGFAKDTLRINVNCKGDKTPPQDSTGDGRRSTDSCRVSISLGGEGISGRSAIRSVKVNGRPEHNYWVRNNKVIFDVPQSRSPISVAVESGGCQWSAGGRPSGTNLALRGNSACDKIAVCLTFGKDLEKFRDLMEARIDNAVADATLADNPCFAIKKTNVGKKLKLVLVLPPDDNGKERVITVCEKSITAEMVNGRQVSWPCKSCKTCLPNIRE